MWVHNWLFKMSLIHWYMAVGLDYHTSSINDYRVNKEGITVIEAKESVSTCRLTIVNTNSRSPFESTQLKRKRKDRKKVGKPRMKATETVVEKSAILEGKTTNLMVLTKMMTGKSLGVTQTNKYFRARLKFKSEKLRLGKTFVLERDAILQYQTWVNQLQLDDGEKSVAPRYEKWLAKLLVYRQELKNHFENNDQAQAFRKIYAKKKYLKLKHDFDSRVFSKISKLTQ